MKKAIVILVFLFALKPILPVLEYVFNYDYIVKELCENKAKPEMKCNGKCHLVKELAKASESDNPVSSHKKVTQPGFEILFLEKIASFEIGNPNFTVQKKINAKYSDLYLYENACAFFHPPAV